MYVKYVIVSISLTFWFCFVNRITGKLHMNFCEIFEYEFGMIKTDYLIT